MSATLHKPILRRDFSDGGYELRVGPSCVVRVVPHEDDWTVVNLAATCERILPDRAGADALADRIARLLAS